MFGSDMRLFKVAESLVEPYATTMEKSVVEALSSRAIDPDSMAVALVNQGALLAMHLSRNSMPIENGRERKKFAKIAWKSLGSEASQRTALVLSVALGLENVHVFSEAGDDWALGHTENFLNAITDRWPLTAVERQVFDDCADLSTSEFRWHMALVATKQLLGDLSPPEIRPDPMAWKLGFATTGTPAAYERRIKNETIWVGNAADWMEVGAAYINQVGENFAEEFPDEG